MAYKVRFANPQKQYADHREEFIKAFDETLTRGDIARADSKLEDDFAVFAALTRHRRQFGLRQFISVFALAESRKKMK